MKFHLFAQLLQSMQSLIYASYSAMLMTTALLVWGKVQGVSLVSISSLFTFNILLGLAHHYFFIRVQFDAKILKMFSQFPKNTLKQNTEQLDEGLHILGLIPQQTETKSWQTRFQGCKKLLIKQLILLSLQYLLCIFIFIWI